jgi:hypothetical protein
MATWADIQRGIFAGESGGDYGALFNYQNRPSGRFSNVDLTQMTVDEALQFADPSGPYAQYVKGQVGRVATPMGAYQVVGSTLRSAKEGLGLTGNERMTPELQDRIGQFIYKTQGTGAWEGYKGPRVSSKGNIPMDQQKPDQERRGGLMGLVDFATQLNPETGLSGIEAFGAALDPLIMPQMRAGEAIRARGAQRVKSQSMNKTIEWLRNNGYPEVAAMVEQNPGIASNVMSAILSKKLAPTDQTTAMQNYQFQISKGVPKEQAMQNAFGKGGTNITLGAGAKVAGDYVIVEDPTSEAGVRFIPIPGGKAAQEAAAETQRKDITTQQTAKKEAVVSGSIDYLVGKLDKGGFFNLPEAGIVGNVLSTLGVNQDAVDFRNELKSVQANIAFDRLQQMREASKTGGALGAVSERELDLLINAYGNIDQSTSPERLKQNLLNIKRIMTKIENDPIASAIYYGKAAPTTQAAPQGGTQVGEPY